jgi:hypothetical protein
MRAGGVGMSTSGVKLYQGGITMRLGREQATGYVEDIEADQIAPAEFATDAPALAQLVPDPRPQPAVIAG